ncbi:MAG: AEC family transporter [Candidatus Pseudobacter hemicellulosilyticus]|uniref:AEC family transporter n=1 Tax=Candidatus Pseudobacter hemicellulosilyticus TaxID=3121375 RepID=A0AAJ6BIZ4_9BACT|nr:MAG: AEC family transporter [Pseudobacter sp.]
MVNFVLIVVCILAGMLFRTTQVIHPQAHKGINTWILYIGLPALSFKYLPQVSWNMDILIPAISSVIVLAGAWLFVAIYCRLKHYSRRTQSTLELSTGYSNTSFIGFPLIAAYYGEQYISIGIICDQMMFILLSTFGIISALKGGADKTKPSAGFLLRRLISFPPFIGCMLAILLSLLVDLSFAVPLFDKLAATVAPLALFSIGLQLKFNGWKKELPQISMTMLYKLLLAPALVVGFALLLNKSGYIVKISVMEAAMPTLVTSSIIAEQFRLNTRLTNLIIGISILVGFITTAFWYECMELLF